MAGWALDSFDVMLYALTITTIMKEWHISPATAGFLTSLTLFSSAFGGDLFGIISDYIGRTRALMITVLISVFTFFCGFMQSVTQPALFQWTAGSVLVSETWPREHHGKAMGFVQRGRALGYMAAAAVAAVILPNFGWRYLFFVGIVPAFLIFYT